MPTLYQWRLAAIVAATVFLAAVVAQAQSISGTVVDPSGAVVPNATVTIDNPVSGYQRSAITDASGKFNFPNVPFNPYHLTVAAQGFAAYAQDTEVRSTVPVNVSIKLTVAGSSTSVTRVGETCWKMSLRFTAT